MQRHNTRKPRRPLQRRNPQKPTGRFDFPEKARVVVQFRPAHRIPYEDGAEKAIEALNVGPWRRLAADFPGITLKRVFRTTKADQLDRLIEKARNNDPQYRPGHFLGYFYVDTTQSTDLAAVPARFNPIGSG